NTSTASTIREGGTQHWVGKSRSLSKGKWPKRARGAAQKRDRSKVLGDVVERTDYDEGAFFQFMLHFLV
ncbi:MULTISPECIES: hypothetical protein, partial [unclassified Sulfitobacter]|uniref:hypothetical protein n=1 Tax=unclassified Sulfitobacter TaxID=196795 RepID=UPI001ADB8032